jgi:uncharacterized lipoprotein NlpE involved in copper resistance
VKIGAFKISQIVLGIAVSIFLSGCGNDGNENTAPKQGAKTENPQATVAAASALNQEAMVGTYVGHLPCETCDGMQTSIILREDNTYAIATKPINDTAFSVPLVDSGHFVMRDSILELTDLAGEIRNYKIAGNRLVQLGADMQPLEAGNNGHYQFVKQ